MTVPTHDSLVVPKAGSVTYGNYLKVNELLSLQSPLTVPAQHDEMLFILIHQVYELWFKQILHDLKLAQTELKHANVIGFLRGLQRIAAIQSVLIHQVDILETMTPVDFNSFRDKLNPASGFQSYQFRELEYRLGWKDPAYLNFHKTDNIAFSALSAALGEPCLYETFVQFLISRGFDISESCSRRPHQSSYGHSEEVLKAVIKIYRASSQHFDLYSVLEALIGLDEGLLLWRSRHVAMVERMIGTRRGTGGSSGVKYLSATLAKRFFPEIWEARNWLGDSQYGAGEGIKPKQ
jgi:tryptophan 2,3-dioxygenase